RPPIPTLFPYTTLFRSLLGVVYPPNKRGRALGAASSAWAIASVAGPLLGTLIVTHVSWRWAFLINVPIAIVAGFLVIAGMHESIDRKSTRLNSSHSQIS